MRHYPKRIRGALIANAKFGEDFATDAVVSFGDVSFQRSTLFDAVRQTFDSRATDSTVNEGEKRILVPILVLMSPDRSTRLSVLRDEANRVNLPMEAVRTWEALLEVRQPDDDYERLVGRYEGELTFDDYVSQVALPHMEDLIKWRPFEGYLQALLLCSQPALSAALGARAEGSDVLGRVFDWLVKEGDVISRTAGVEIGLSLLKSNATLQRPLAQLVSAVAAVKQPQPYDRYKLLSSLAIVVYGEIARTRILAQEPPFWRKLAAIAQAASIERCIIAVAGDATEFTDWAMSARGELFLLQCFVDLRLEPRWIPELVMPDQLKNEFGGRVWRAANNNREDVTAAGLGHLLLDDRCGKRKRSDKDTASLFAGPT
jgi:hypothetical protein